MTMNLFRSMPVLWFFLIAQVFLAGCVQTTNYAPVIGSKPIFDKDSSQVIPENKANARDNIQTPAEAKVQTPVPKPETQGLGNYYVVKKGDTLYSIGVLTGYGYERLAQWNQIQPPFHVNSGRRLKLFESDSGSKMPYRADNGVVRVDHKKDFNNTAVPLNTPKKLENKPDFLTKKPIQAMTNTVFKQEKKSIISTDNKKMLKLNFAWPIKGRISRNFNPSSNKGIDIAGKMGQKVQAAEAGKIAYSGQGLIGFGNLIIIKHNDLYLSAYGNNSSLLVREGEQVEKGQIIAEVGKVLSKKTALHFEIRKNGKPVNPLKYLPKSDKAH